MGDIDAGVVLLTCADDLDAERATRRVTPAGWHRSPPTSAGSPCRRPGDGLRTVAVPARPTRADLDPLLADPDLRRLVVAGTDADLAAVLVRLLRTTRLDVELAYVPVDRRSPAARVWGLPHGPAALELARRGVARPAPLVRDDTGGVLVGRAEVRGVGRGALRGEAYCDGELVLRGAARRLVVTPWPDAPPIDLPTSATTRAAPTGAGPPAPLLRPAAPAVAIRAGRTGALPDGRAHPVPPNARVGRGAGVGRAVQLGCLPATVVTDGVAHPRPVPRWAWYRHVADWLLVRPGRQPLRAPSTA